MIFANGLSAPQHSTYLVILDDGRDRDGGPPGVAGWLGILEIKNLQRQCVRNENNYRFHPGISHGIHRRWTQTFFSCP